MICAECGRDRECHPCWRCSLCEVPRRHCGMLCCEKHLYREHPGWTKAPETPAGLAGARDFLRCIGGPPLNPSPLSPEWLEQNGYRRP